MISQALGHAREVNHTLHKPACFVHTLGSELLSYTPYVCGDQTGKTCC